MSKLFYKTFDSGCSGCVRICECGVTHFDSYNLWDWEDGELESLQYNAEKTPDKFIERDYAIGTISIAGVEIVQNCTCNLAQQYEDFIINHAPKIAKYLNKRAAMLEKHAKEIKCIYQDHGQ